MSGCKGCALKEWTDWPRPITACCILYILLCYTVPATLQNNSTHPPNRAMSSAVNRQLPTTGTDWSFHLSHRLRLPAPHTQTWPHMQKKKQALAYIIALHF